MNRQDLDNLHEEASGLYLQGDHEGALAAWTKLLEHQPDDERALEGIRLCEQMVGGTEETVWTPGASPFAVGGDRAGVMAAPSAIATESAGSPGSGGAIEPPADDLQDALDELDAQLDFGAGNPSRVDAKEQSAEPDSGGFLDLSDLAEEEEEEEEAGDEAIPFGETPPSESAGAVSNDQPSSTWTWGGETAGDGPDEGALELRRRVNEMLANALVAYEGGRKTQALKTLERLLEIDEDNDPAQSLRDKIAREVEAGPSAPLDDTAPMDEPIPEMKSGDAVVGLGEPLELADLQDAAPTQEPLDLLEPLDTLEDAPAPADDDDWPQRDDDEATDPTDEAADGVAATTAPEASSSRTKLLILLGIVLVGAVGWQGWQMLNAPVQETPQPTVATPALDAFLEEDPPDVEQVEQPARPVEPVVSDVSGVLSAADSAFKDENYALAVIRYGDVLKLDPNHAMARERLRVSGERYRVRKEIELQWERVFTSFQSADYANALRILYRFPETEDQDRIGRLKTAAWYNLGLDRLKAADCEGAKTNFKEARELSPEDTGVARGISMARACASNPDPAFAKTVASMTPRDPGR